MELDLKGFQFVLKARISLLESRLVDDPLFVEAEQLIDPVLG